MRRWEKKVEPISASADRRWRSRVHRYLVLWRGNLRRMVMVVLGNAGNEGFARQGGGHVNGSGGTATGVVVGTRSGGTGSGVEGQFYLLVICIGGLQMLSLRLSFVSMGLIKRMGETQFNRNQQMAQAALAQARRVVVMLQVKLGATTMQQVVVITMRIRNFQGGGDNNRGYGRGNWGRGNGQGMGNRGPTGPMRNRPGGMGGRGIMGNGGNGFGQGIGVTPPLLHPQTMMGQGFDPAFGAPMGRMGSYGGFPGAPTPPFSGILSSFPPVGSVGLPGVAPHVNPAFFGRGLPMNGMGMMPTTGVEGHNMGMWSDPNMAGWAGEEHAGRAGESSYGEEAMSDHQYGEVTHDRGGWQNSMKEKDGGSERDWSGHLIGGIEMIEILVMIGTCLGKDIGHDPERRHRDDRDVGQDRGGSGGGRRDRDCVTVTLFSMIPFTALMRGINSFLPWETVSLAHEKLLKDI
ncbi:hypothetical protein LOK49_LG06G00303 [Camellia lanceoleosa]|uniref:Uncharacterized protein n=1 Tax=Camellia lanceoleosa TaxID=1840588 RepID=A0ACC0HA72_9ERIC|nr:hypothetical protein LOK49_LG06G00303 [Camellia lanceoleosa]